MEYWGTLASWVGRDQCMPVCTHLSRVSHTVLGAVPAVPHAARLEGSLSSLLDKLADFRLYTPTPPPAAATTANTRLATTNPPLAILPGKTGRGTSTSRNSIVAATPLATEAAASILSFSGSDRNVAAAKVAPFTVGSTTAAEDRTAASVHLELAKQPLACVESRDITNAATNSGRRQTCTVHSTAVPSRPLSFTSSSVTTTAVPAASKLCLDSNRLDSVAFVAQANHDSTTALATPQTRHLHSPLPEQAQRIVVIDHAAMPSHTQRSWHALYSPSPSRRCAVCGGALASEVSPADDAATADGTVAGSVGHAAPCTCMHYSWSAETAGLQPWRGWRDLPASSSTTTGTAVSGLRSLQARAGSMSSKAQRSAPSTITSASSCMSTHEASRAGSPRSRGATRWSTVVGSGNTSSACIAWATRRSSASGNAVSSVGMYHCKHNTSSSCAERESFNGGVSVGGSAKARRRLVQLHAHRSSQTYSMGNCLRAGYLDRQAGALMVVLACSRAVAATAQSDAQSHGNPSLWSRETSC